MEQTRSSPDTFIASLPDEAGPVIERLDKEITKIMKGDSRTLWKGTFWGGSEQKIIGYGDLVYERKGKTVKWFKIGLALQKNYISLYVNAVEGNKYLGQILGGELGRVKIGASSISFKRLDDVDMPRLRELLKRARSLLKADAR